jgi:diguanylate cyclase (GGDEF)-like protein
MLLSYLCFAITTVMQNDFLITVFSPITALLIGILIIKCIDRMGSFVVPTLLLALGVFMWALADILTFFNTWMLHKDAIDSLITIIFLLPNYFFGFAIALYFFKKLKGRELYHFLINSFTLTIVSFVAFRKILEHLHSFDRLLNFDLIRVYLYFFINLLIIIMIVHMLYMSVSEAGIRGINAIMTGIFFYIMLDIPYTYQQAIGNDPENIYQNLMYMFCMMLIAYGILRQALNKHTYRLKTYIYTENAVKRTRLIVVTGIVISCFLWMGHFLAQNDFFYLLITLLAYWIMTSTFHNDSLSEQLLKQQDILTGLYNRRYINTVMEEAVTAASETGTRFAVYCIDLNSFKPINDTYGHDMGDQVLREFGSRMLELSSDYVSFRTGGDEFMIIRKSIENSTDVTDSAQTIQSLFNRPVNVVTYTFRLSGSIGVAVYPEDSDNTETLMRYADAAMYTVKHSTHKDGYRIFDRSLIDTVEIKRLLESRLKNADPARDFALYYQPRVSSQTGELIGAEVFPRLRGEDEYSAAQLLPIAEEVGLMKRLSIWIAETAIRQLCAWNKDRKDKLYISLNLSPLQLLDKDFVEFLTQVTKELDIDTSLIHLDIGNSVIMGASDTAKDTLVYLSKFGFSLALNDFGGDDINLLHILDCGFSIIHLSPSLVRRLDSDKKAEVLIRSIIALTESMSITAAAVGVETAGQEKILKEMGIHSLQGYYYGRPQEAQAFESRFILQAAAQ